MDRDCLDRRLRQTFDASDGERRVVLREALDLHDDGRYADTHGAELTVEDVLDTHHEAPEDLGLVERWNWWVGALELAHGGYEAFRVRRYRED